MAAGSTTNAGQTTVTFAYQRPTAAILNKLGKAAAYLFHKGYGKHGTEAEPITFDELSNQQKLDIIDEWLIDSVKNMAATHIADTGHANTADLVAAERELEFD